MAENEIKLDSIESALADFREGKMVIVVDDEDRENEGDLIVAAEKITPEQVNFMLKNARGVLCAPVTLERCKELDLLPHGGEQHIDARHPVHRECRQARRMHHRSVNPRPLRHHPSFGRSCINARNIWPSRPHQSPLCPEPGCAPPYGGIPRPLSTLPVWQDCVRLLPSWRS